MMSPNAAQQSDVLRASDDIADAHAYGEGLIEWAEYRDRALARYADVEVPARGPDPVATFDAMWEAATSIMGSYVRLADHAATEPESSRWWQAHVNVINDRKQVDALDVNAQQAALGRYLALGRSLRSL
jgi:hypothetical protein